MPFISSPVAYPPSSSPQLASTKKRKRADVEGRSPLRPKTANLPQRHGLFEEDSDSDQSNHEVLEQETSKQATVHGKGNVAVQQVKTTTVTTISKSGSQPALGSSIFSQTRKVQEAPYDDFVDIDSAALITPPSSQGEGSTIRSTSGRFFTLRKRVARKAATYEQIIASRSVAIEGKARRSYYGIDINSLLETAEAESIIAENEKLAAPAVQTVETTTTKSSKGRTLMWTEKYRARRFTDLVGDDRTHRTVMHWLKAWDPLVFPGSAKRTHLSKNRQQQPDQEQKQHRKILLLTGPPGLGKTTLAHVCAKQAGYEVTEINASDDRSKDVVKGRIRDMLGTENVKTGSTTASGAKKIAKPICVIVDEVDGVVSGSSGGEGGFMKALIDLVLLDQKNARNATGQTTTHSKRKGDNFRMMRPLIMICNDAYHASLRPLRSSNLVEIIHCGRPALDTVATRVQSIFEREGIGADGDAVRRLCEGCWGIVSKKEGGAGAGAGEGDIRSVLVMSEWIAARVISTAIDSAPRLTKKWLETNMSDPTANGAIRGLGRGGSKEIVDRVFMEGAGLSRPSATTTTSSNSAELTTSVKSVNEALKAASSNHLRTLIDGHGESDRIMTDLFTSYPSQPFQDDNFLTKPSQAYEWLHFHDHISSAVFSSSEWELAPYLSTPALGFHHLFATSAATRARYTSYSKPAFQSASELTQAVDEPHPFTLPSASFAAHERQKTHMAMLQTLHENLSLPLTRLYPRIEGLAVEFVPYLLRMLAPNVNPVLITSSTSTGSGQGKGDNRTSASVRKASERLLIERSVRAMTATGCRFERHRVEMLPGQQGAGGKNVGGWVYRLVPGLDEYGVYDTAGKGWGNDVCGTSSQGGRYGVRQVLVQECQSEERRVEGEKRGRRGKKDDDVEEEQEENVVEIKKGKGVKRDFFGRVVVEIPRSDGIEVKEKSKENKDEGRIWVSFHEGYSNAVRKPITLKELMRGL
ncbi:ATPase-like protein 2 [Elsinoe fawcettii]|nr:ATPase-like protein 2 [Elsinoe fawcettii]